MLPVRPVLAAVLLHSSAVRLNPRSRVVRRPQVPLGARHPHLHQRHVFPSAVHRLVPVPEERLDLLHAGHQVLAAHHRQDRTGSAENLLVLDVRSGSKPQENLVSLRAPQDGGFPFEHQGCRLRLRDHFGLQRIEDHRGGKRGQSLARPVEHHGPVGRDDPAPGVETDPLQNGPARVVASKAGCVSQSRQVLRSEIECLCGAGFGHRRNLLVQAFPGFLQPALHRVRAQLQQVGGLPVGVALEVVVDDHVPVWLAQLCHRLAHQPCDLLLPGLGRGLRFELIEKVELGETAPLPHARLVVGDRAQPGAEALRGTQRRQLLVRGEQSLLQDVFGRLSRPQPADEPPQQPRSVLLDQHLEGLRISGQSSLHPVAVPVHDHPVVARRRQRYPKRGAGGKTRATLQARVGRGDPVAGTGSMLPPSSCCRRGDLRFLTRAPGVDPDPWQTDDPALFLDGIHRRSNDSQGQIDDSQWQYDDR